MSLALAETGRCLRCMTPIPGSAKCPACGLRDDNTAYDLQCAPPGTVLSGRYLLGISLRKNGEGVLYAGYDNSLQQKVWIREYFPPTLARRAPETGAVVPVSGCGAQYKALYSDFVDVCNEVKRLGVTEPVVPLENVISQNNTVYAIYKGLNLISFEDFLERKGGKLKPRNALALLLPIFGTLDTLHTHGQIHRGISPFTVFAEEETGQLYLWDFALGAVRTAGSELEAELFSGFSAPEQYYPNGWQGSWTDVYSVAALLYRAISGIVPPKAIRIGRDRPLEPLEAIVPGLPNNISEAVRAAMLSPAKERTQTIQTFISQMISKESGTAVYDAKKSSPRRKTSLWKRRPKKKPAAKGRGAGGAFKYAAVGTFAMLMLLSGVIWFFVKFMYPEIIGLPPGSGPAPAANNPSETPAAPETINRVPKFFGMRYADIENAAEYKGKFNFSVREEFSDIFEAGTVYDQSPQEGNRISEGETTVILYVSKGPTTHTMPNLKGYTLQEGTNALSKLEGVTVEIFTRYEAGAKPGIVLGSLPEADTVFDPKQQKVFLFVSPEASVPEASASPQSESAAQQQASQAQPYAEIKSGEDIFVPPAPR